VQRLTDRLVARGYDRVADAYAALEGELEWPRLRRLRELLELLPKRARVLDLGCGSGVPATRALVDAGHTVVGVDVSREQAERARRYVPEAQIVEASALELELEAESLDAVVAFYVIDHLPREEHGTLLASIRSWLRPGGWLLLTFDTADHPGVVADWLGTPMFFSQFDPETSERLVREAGFDVVSAARETQLEGTREVTFLWVLARRPPGRASGHV
jgi:cyclopropane fatty-acyl-phospholipid synthase-like methyltransferase